MKSGTFTLASVLLLAAGAAAAQESPPASQPAATQSPAGSVGLFAFPATNQTPEQQATDESQCYYWTTTQTGYDPKNPPKVEAKPAETADTGPSGERVKGAVRGAAAGAVIGEVADND